jgi:PIN domain nuclease of toxin-antitoxin system
VKYLLDTHTFIWMAASPDMLSAKVVDIVTLPENDLLLSVASGWETTLLWKLNRIDLPEDPEIFIPQIIQSLSLTPLSISFETAITAASLPLIHRDPFDRLLVAIAMQKQIAILSKDRMLEKYTIQTIW